MTIYNKLKIAILTILSSQHLYAITLDPLQIQSAPGELLYAEMSFHQADANSKLDVSLATPEDLMMLGAIHQPPAALNFFTRRNNKGEGVIVITSSRPMTDAELNIIVKIQENGAVHLKHIRQPIRQKTQIAAAKSSNEKTLAPKYIVSEKDIALNLPESTRYNANAATNSKETNLKQEKLLNAPFALPPALNIPESKAPVVTAISVAPPAKAEQTTTIQAASNTQATTPKILSTEQKPATPTIKQEVQQAAVVQAANNPTPPPISNTAVPEQKPSQPMKIFLLRNQSKILKINLWKKSRIPWLSIRQKIKSSQLNSHRPKAPHPQHQVKIVNSNIWLDVMSHYGALHRELQDKPSNLCTKS